MKNPTRSKNPYHRNPLDFDSPFEQPRRPRPAPARRNPYAMKPQTGGMDNLANGIVNIATLGMAGGVAIGLMNAIPKTP